MMVHQWKMWARQIQPFMLGHRSLLIKWQKSPGSWRWRPCMERWRAGGEGGWNLGRIDACALALLIRAWWIIEPSCLAISQVTRAKLYNKCLLFILKKFLSPIPPYNTFYLGPLMHMLLCPAWCLRGSQALISLIPSLLYISISLAISPLLYLLLMAIRSSCASGYWSLVERGFGWALLERSRVALLDTWIPIVFLVINSPYIALVQAHPWIVLHF
jgi:hypothetical protein